MDAVVRGMTVAHDDRRTASGPSRPTTSAASPSVGAARAAAAVLVFFTAVTAVMTYPQVRYLDRRVADLGDPLLKMWGFAWVAHQLPLQPAHLLDANIFYPETRTLAYTDLTLLPAFSVALLLWLGIDPVLAYNLLLMSAFILSGVCTFLLVRSLTDHVGAAIFAGIVFAYLPYRFDQYANVELQIAFWMPLGLWAVHRMIDHGGIRYGLLGDAFVAAQALSSLYYGIFFVTYLIPFCAVLLIGKGWSGATRAWRPLLAGALLAATLVAPLAVPYFANRNRLGERSRAEVAIWSAEARSYLGAPAGNVMYGRFRWLGGRWHLFPGVVAVILTIAAFRPPLSAVRAAYGAGLVFAFDASLGVHGLAYSLLYAWLPPYRALRVPLRFTILAGLSLAVLSGFGVERVCARVRRASIKKALPIALGGVALLEYWSGPLKLAEV